MSPASFGSRLAPETTVSSRPGNDSFENASAWSFGVSRTTLPSTSKSPMTPAVADRTAAGSITQLLGEKLLPVRDGRPLISRGVQVVHEHLAAVVVLATWHHDLREQQRRGRIDRDVGARVVHRGMRCGIVTRPA